MIFRDHKCYIIGHLDIQIDLGNYRSASSGIVLLLSFSLPTNEREAGAIQISGPTSSPVRFSSIVFSTSLATVLFEDIVVKPDHHPKKNTDGFIPLRTSETFSATGGSFDLTVNASRLAIAEEK